MPMWKKWKKKLNSSFKKDNSNIITSLDAYFEKINNGTEKINDYFGPNKNKGNFAQALDLHLKNRKRSFWSLFFKKSDFLPRAVLEFYLEKILEEKASDKNILNEVKKIEDEFEKKMGNVYQDACENKFSILVRNKEGGIVEKNLSGVHQTNYRFNILNSRIREGIYQLIISDKIRFLFKLAGITDMDIRKNKIVKKYLAKAEFYCYQSPNAVADKEKNNHEKIEIHEAEVRDALSKTSSGFSM